MCANVKNDDESKWRLTDKEAKEQGDGDEGGVVVAEGDQEDAEGGQDDGHVGHHQGVDPGKVAEPAEEDAADGVGDADDGDEESGVLSADGLLRWVFKKIISVGIPDLCRRENRFLGLKSA